jgi:hypothetical protein
MLYHSAFASTYYVRADGTAVNKSTAIGPVTDSTQTMSVAVFNSQTFSDGDTVIFSSRGGNFNNTAVVFPSGGSTFANRIIYKGESGFEPTFDGQNTTDVILKVASKNNLEIQSMTVTRPVTSGVEIGGTSGGIIVKDIVSTYSGNQAFQNLDTASTTYYNITGSHDVDDGFSMHDASRANIFNGTFEDNDQNVNTIKGTTLYADNLTIRGCIHQCIYLVNSYGTSEITSATLKNILIENSTATGTPIYLSTHASTTIDNLIIRNISSSGITNNQGLITLDSDAQLDLKNFSITGNTSTSYLMSAIMTINTTATKGKNLRISNGIITDLTGHAIDSYEDFLTMDHVLIKDLASGKYAVVVRNGVGSLKNLTVFDNNKNNNGLFVTGASSTLNATNTIIYNVGTALNNSSGSGSTAYSTNFGNTSASSGTWSQTNTLNTNPLFVSTTSENFNLLSTSTLIDAGINLGSTGDASGNPIYGNPDIGAYEYQPPFALGTSLIDTSGYIRIYGDRRFRYTTATSSTMSADFSVAPAEGSWSYGASTTRPEWLNVGNFTWRSSGDYYKAWIASSTSATTTVYTIGNMRASTTYLVAIDGAATSTASSDTNGRISFSYSGNYSTNKLFTITSDTTAPQVTLTSPTAGSTIGGASVTVSATSTDNAYVYGVQFYYASTTIGTLITATSSENTYSTVWDTTNIPNGAYQLYAVAQDASLNYATSSLITINISNTTGNTSASNVSTVISSSGGQASQSFLKSIGLINTKATDSSVSTVSRDLKIGSKGDDVKSLQVFLNKNGFVISKTGPGSPGNETDIFGALTRKALADFQSAYSFYILKPAGFKTATGVFGPATRKFIQTEFYNL